MSVQHFEMIEEYGFWLGTLHWIGAILMGFGIYALICMGYELFKKLIKGEEKD